MPTGPRVPWRSSVTIWEETAPVKLPDEHGPVAGLDSPVDHRAVHQEEGLGDRAEDVVVGRGGVDAEDEFEPGPRVAPGRAEPLHLAGRVLRVGRERILAGGLPLPGGSTGGGAAAVAINDALNIALIDIVRWTVNALFWAELNGITSQNIDEKLASGGPDIQRVLGGEAGFGKPLGLDDKWAYNVIKQVGNYAEIWDRNLGKDSPLKVDRGLNKLWKDGGLNYPYPWE